MDLIYRDSLRLEHYRSRVLYWNRYQRTGEPKLFRIVGRIGYTGVASPGSSEVLTCRSIDQKQERPGLGNPGTSTFGCRGLLLLAVLGGVRSERHGGTIFLLVEVDSSDQGNVATGSEDLLAGVLGADKVHAAH